MRVVIVEDHPMIREILIMALRSGADYRVDGFSTGQDGIEACLQGASVAIFDHHLPDMTGTEAIERLRADPRTAHMPIIVVTGEHDNETKLNAIRSGATEFLTKPVDIEEFRLRVGNLLAMYRAQKSAQDRSALLETLISSSEAAIAVADASDPARPLLHISAALQRLFGSETLAAASSAYSLLDLAQGINPQLSALREALAKNDAGRFTLHFSPANGPADGFWSEVKLQPVPAPGADARYIVISHNDISSMVQMRADLSRVEARLSDIASISQAWFFEVDVEFRLAYVSEGMAQAFGVRPRDIVGQHVDHLGVRLKEPAHKGMTISDLLKASGTRPVHELLSFKMPDGRLLSVQVSMVPFLTEFGGFAGFRGYAGDVSALAEARDQAERASRMKSAFLAMISHEMRTPLTAIMGLSDSLIQTSGSEAQSRDFECISRAAHDLSQVLGDVLDMAQMEDGPLKLNSQPFDLVATWDKATASYCALAEEKGLVFDLRVTGAAAGQRQGDADRIAQLVRHLLSNAVKFTEQGRIIAALDLTSADHVKIEIRDTGIGIAPDKLERVFDPFQQLDDRMERRFGGQGIGLPIARWLAQSMQGHLTLRSREGQGTVATLSLPLPQSAKPEPALGELDLRGRAVLVTDDSAANRHILNLMLRKLEARVTLCEDAAQALDIWGHEHFDLLLLDINMPNMTGTDLIREIRRREAAAAEPPVPALAVTANARPDQVRDYLDAGFDGCVAKPFTSSRLLDQISQVM